MAERRFVMRPSRARVHIGCMDVVAILIGIVAFAILLVLIEGIDRV